jgi:hypothetical protein
VHLPTTPIRVSAGEIPVFGGGLEIQNAGDGQFTSSPI